MAKASLSVQERLKRLLEIESVEKVYVVDEEVGKTYTFEDFSGYVRKAEAEKKEDELSNLEGLELSGNLEVALSRIESNWNEWDDEKQKNAIAQVAGLTNPEISIEISSDAQQSSKLTEIFGRDTVEYLTPENWSTRKHVIVESTVSPKKVIVLFDEELQQGEQRKGHHLIQEVKDQNWLDRIVPILYSNGIASYQDELPSRKVITESNQGLTVQDFFAMAKSRANEAEDFADGIKKALLNRYCEQIKTKSVDVLKKAFAKAIAEVEELDTYHFDEVVLKSSHAEGIWEGFTFHRIAGIMLDDAIHQEMTKNDYIKTINTGIRTAKKISDNEAFSPVSLIPYQEKFKLRRQEIYLDGDVINPLFFPIENGDVFELINGQKHHYILVAQECDLMVRSSNGKRRAKLGTLLPMVQKPEEPVIKLKCQNEGAKTCEVVMPKRQTTYPDHEFELPYYDETTNKHWVVQFNKPIFVNLDLLDLVVFNTDGQAKMKLTEKEHDEHSFSFSWAKRYELIRKELLEKLTKATSVLKGVDAGHLDEIKPKIYPAFSFPDNLLVPSFDEETIELSLKRIKRLRSPYSKTLLDKFTRYQSRVADLHDFAR